MSLIEHQHTYNSVFMLLNSFDSFLLATTIHEHFTVVRADEYPRTQHVGTRHDSRALSALVLAQFYCRLSGSVGVVYTRETIPPFGIDSFPVFACTI